MCMHVHKDRTQLVVSDTVLMQSCMARQPSLDHCMLFIRMSVSACVVESVTKGIKRKVYGYVSNCSLLWRVWRSENVTSN